MGLCLCVFLNVCYCVCASVCMCVYVCVYVRVSITAADLSFYVPQTDFDQTVSDYKYEWPPMLNGSLMAFRRASVSKQLGVDR